MHELQNAYNIIHYEVIYRTIHTVKNTQYAPKCMVKANFSLCITIQASNHEDIHVVVVQLHAFLTYTNSWSMRLSPRVTTGQDAGWAV